MILEHYNKKYKIHSKSISKKIAERIILCIFFIFKIDYKCQSMSQT